MWVKALTTIVIVFLCFVGVANASLTVIGTANYLGNDYNLIYDDVQYLVWLDYSRERDYWENHMDWAAGLGNELTVKLKPGYKTSIDWSTGWRLPIVDESKICMDCGGGGYEGPDENGYYWYSQGYNMLNGELNHLYYLSLGNKGYVALDGTQPQPGWGLQNTGPFNNFAVGQGDGLYYTGTLVGLNRKVWVFLLADEVPWTNWSQQHAGYMKTSDIYRSAIGNAMAVHPGSVSSVSVDDILEFFDESVADGSLEGYGPGNSASGRLNALRNMLEMAGELIIIDDIEGACVQLKAALGKCDGESPPPDFVAGLAASELKAMIIDLMAELGCE